MNSISSKTSLANKEYEPDLIPIVSDLVKSVRPIIPFILFLYNLQEKGLLGRYNIPMFK